MKLHILALTTLLGITPSLRSDYSDDCLLLAGGLIATGAIIGITSLGHKYMKHSHSEENKQKVVHLYVTKKKLEKKYYEELSALQQSSYIDDALIAQFATCIEKYASIRDYQQDLERDIQAIINAIESGRTYRQLFASKQKTQILAQDMERILPDFEALLNILLRVQAIVNQEKAYFNLVRILRKDLEIMYYDELHVCNTVAQPYLEAEIIRLAKSKVSYRERFPLIKMVQRTSDDRAQLEQLLIACNQQHNFNALHSHRAAYERGYAVYKVLNTIHQVISQSQEYILEKDKQEYGKLMERDIAAKEREARAREKQAQAAHVQAQAALRAEENRRIQESNRQLELQAQIYGVPTLMAENKQLKHNNSKLSREIDRCQHALVDVTKQKEYLERVVTHHKTQAHNAQEHIHHVAEEILGKRMPCMNPGSPAFNEHLAAELYKATADLQN
jgi:hypothetical protein